MKEDILHSALKEVQLYGDFQSHKAEIDAEDMGWILQILSTNLYSDPIGSLIREYSSNAWDANVEAGNKDKPIEVGVQTNKDGGTYWYVTDLGPGLSPSRINDVYRKFGKSTKRSSNEAIGMMGLGKFSGLSYTNEVFITTRVDGIEYQYLMHKSEGIPQIDMLESRDTNLPNGTTIRVNIQGWKDKHEFVTKTREQLAYFENVYFNVDSENFNDKFKIVKGKTFTQSTLDSRSLRIKIGPVSYPIDWNVITHPLNILRNSISNMAVNFNIGEVAITPNRESVLYNKLTIENINNRFTEVIEELKELYEKQVLEYESPRSYLEALGTAYVKIGDMTHNIHPLVNNGQLNFKKPVLKGLDIPTLNVKNVEDLLYGYRQTYTIQNNRRSEKKYHSVPYIDEKTDKYVFVDKCSIEPKHNKYMSEKLGKSYFHIIQKHKMVKLIPKDSITQSYYNILGLKKVAKSKWRETIKTFIAWQEAFVEKHTIRYDDYVPSKDWLKAQKALIQRSDTKSLRKMQGKVLVKVPEKSYGYRQSCVFRSTDWQINTLDSKHRFIVYGTEDNKELLSNLWYFTKISILNFEVIITAKANHKYLQLLPNFMHIDKFMEGKTRYFKRFISLYRLYSVYSSSDSKSLYSCLELLQYLNKSLYDSMIEIKERAKLYEAIRPSYQDANFEALIEAMEDTAEANNLYDWEIETYRTDLLKNLKTYGFLDNIAYIQKSYDYTRKYTESHKNFAVFASKAMKVKLNTEFYQNDRQPKAINQEEEVNSDSN
jgi:hypothetical protein